MVLFCNVGLFWAKQSISEYNTRGQMQLKSKTLLQTSILAEINIFHSGISCLFVMCLQNGMLCLFVIHIPVICLLTLGKIRLLTFNQYIPKWNILICVTISSIYSNIYFFFLAWTSKLKMVRRELPC